jgi:hypothetical protein
MRYSIFTSILLQSHSIVQLESGVLNPAMALGTVFGRPFAPSHPPAELRHC